MPHYPDLPQDVTFLEVNGSSRYLFRTGERASYVSPLFRLIVLAMLEGASQSEILVRVNGSGLLSQPLTAEVLGDVISKKIYPELVQGRTSQDASGNSIGFRMAIAKFQKHRWPLAVGRLFFKPPVFRAAVVVSSIISLIFVLAHNASFLAPNDNRTAAHVAIAAILAVTGLLHEMGHASAADYYGAPPGEIGIGLYLVFPVFYADVTNAWSLTPRQRVVVNLGGIYFQLLLNVVLIGLFYALGDATVKSVLHTCVFLSLGLVAVNLTPFLKFDGYWVYSDFFRIENLRRASVEQVLRLRNRFAHRDLIRPTAITPLSVYTVGSVIFSCFFLISLGGYLYSTALGAFDMGTVMWRATTPSELWASISMATALNSLISALFLKRGFESALVFARNRKTHD